MQTQKTGIPLFSLWFLMTVTFLSCNSEKKDDSNYPNVAIVGAMKDVMWKGELDGRILLDSLSKKNNLYGIGPESYLTGELLINNGKSYVSKVASDSTMMVNESYDVSAPFFVYATVNEWEKIDLPSSVKTIKQLEQFIDAVTLNYKRPFAFKLDGQAAVASIHVQNLPEGSTVSSPKEAHQGQVNYRLKDEEVEVIGFFSTKHQGIFTHHNSYLHMHLITKDESKMGHMDQLEIAQMQLYLPKK